MSHIKNERVTNCHPFIYNNISCQGLLDNWVSGVVRG